MSPESDTSLTILMVAYGPPEALSSCLATIGSDYPVVIVDNGSSPKARAVAEEAGARYVDPGRNLGFAGGVNLAIAQLTPPIGDVLLINPDAEITSSDIELLRRELHRDPSLACVAPVLLDASTERPIRSSWPFPSPGRAWLDAVGLGKLVPQGEFLIGAVLMLSEKAVSDIGTFDERFFLYAEETDWQRRGIEKGWRIRQVKGASARHVGAGAGGDPMWREAAFLAGVERYIRKWFGPSGWAVFRVGAGLAAARRTLGGTVGSRAAARRRVAIYLREPEQVANKFQVPLLPLAPDDQSSRSSFG
ncbi:MAG: glycosyltransferase family 2 protein [Acidimicrobiales bacterium]